MPSDPWLAVGTPAPSQDPVAAPASSELTPDPWLAVGSKDDPWKAVGVPKKFYSGDPDSIKTAATNPGFDPVAHVAENPDDPHALDFAAKVVDYQNRNVSTGDSFKQNLSSAASGIVPAVKSLAKGALSTVQTAANAVKEGSAERDALKAGDIPTAEQHHAQFKADSLALMGAGQSGTMQAGNMAPHLARWGGDKVTGQPDLDTIKGRLQEYATVHNQTADAEAGKLTGMVPNFISTPQEIAAAGGKITPVEYVQNMSQILNPTNVIPFGEGAAVGRVLLRAPELAVSGVGKVAAAGARAVGHDADTAAAIGENAAIRAQQATDAISSVPRQAIGGALQAVGVTGEAAQKIAGAVATSPIVKEAVPVLGAAYALSDDDPKAAVSALLGYGAGRIGLRAIRKAAGSKIFESIGDAGAAVRAGDLTNPLAGKGALAGVASDALETVGKGAVGGAAIGGISQLGQERPGAVGEGIGGGAALGAAGGAAGHALGGKALNAYFKDANDPGAAAGPLKTSSPAYGVDPGLDAAHQTAMATLTPAQQATFNQYRNLGDAMGARIYGVDTGTFRKLTGQDSRGAHLPNGDILVNVDHGIDSLSHEITHSLQADMQANDPARLEALYRNIKPDDLQSFTDEYNKRLLQDNPNATPLDPSSPTAKQEYLSEQMQHVMAGRPIAQVGAKSRFSTLLIGAVGRAVERVTGSSLSDATSQIGAKTSFLNDKLLRDYLDQKANSPGSAQPPPTNGNPSRTPQGPQAGAPAQPVAGQAGANAAPAGKAVHPAAPLAKAVVAAGEAVPFQRALGSAADAVAEGKLNGPYDTLTYLKAHLFDSPIWKKMNDQQRQTMVDFVLDRPDQVFDLFHDESPAPARPAPPAPQPEPAPVPASNGAVGSEPVEPSASDTLHIPARKVMPNVRVGPTKAPTTSFERLHEDEFRPGEQPPGLKLATRRKLEDDGSISSVEQTHLTGTGFDKTNPEEMKLLDEAKKHVPNPPVFQEALDAATEAINEGKNLSFNYRSAQREAEGSPTRFESMAAQSDANVGLTSRQEVEKTLSPTGFDVRPKKLEAVFTRESRKNALQKAKDYYQNLDGRHRPAFKDLEEASAAIKDIAAKRSKGQPLDGYTQKQAAEAEKFLDKEERPVVYLKGYSPDKVIANAKNLAEALKTSGLQLDRRFSQLHTYLTSKGLSDDLYTRNQNMRHGYRGDGQPFLDADGKPIASDPDFNPIPLDDWKSQALNVVEGGPSDSYYKEFNANAPSAGRAQIDPKGGANPILNDLRGLGKDLALKRPIGTVAGINNIIDSASETIRLDRITRVHGKSDITVPPSSYLQRSAAFMPSGATNL